MQLPSLAELVADVESVATQAASSGEPPETAVVDAMCTVYVQMGRRFGAQQAGGAAPLTDADLVCLGAHHEALLERLPRWDGSRVRLQPGSTGRKAAGAYFTPVALVEHLLDLALEPVLDEAVDPGSVRVLDPACGSGLFLVLAARRVARRLGTRGEASAVACVSGVDRDRAAVELARVSLAYSQPSGPDREPTLAVGDALLDPAIPSGAFDVVVGNPPFLNQLERLTTTRDRRQLAQQSHGTLRPYTDLAVVFLQRSVGWLREGGRVALVQPQSLLAARDAAAVRRYLAEHCALEALWASDRPLFAANVLTCAPVLRRDGSQGAVARTFGPAFTELPPAREVDLSAEWSFLLAPALGVPRVSVTTARGRVGDLAECTADFRDQYYGLAPYVHEATDRPGGAPLITTGLIDPAECRWGMTPARFLKRRWDAPVVDVEAISQDPGLAGWAQARRVPKVLVGTQGRVVEAVADEIGEWLPSVPTITVTPAREDLWRVLAVLLAPPVSAFAATTYAGTALTMQAIKLGARQVADLPLPKQEGPWHEAAELLRRAQDDDIGRRALLEEAGALMCRAYGPDTEVLAWWRGRLPVRVPQSPRTTTAPPEFLSR